MSVPIEKVERQRGNLKLHRARVKTGGWRRIDVTLTAEEWAALEGQRRPGETHSLAIGRIVVEHFHQSCQEGA